MTRVGNGRAGLPSMAAHRSKHMALGVCAHSHTRTHTRSPCPWRSLGQTAQSGQHTSILTVAPEPLLHPEEPSGDWLLPRLSLE